jgi:GAF domain-containing protein
VLIVTMESAVKTVNTRIVFVVGEFTSMAQGEATGVLMLQAAGEKSSLISPDSLRLAPIVAEQIALALSNLDLRDKLRDQAIRDPLTGLFNRRYFEETAERELHRAECRDVGAAVIVIDISTIRMGMMPATRC